MAKPFSEKAGEQAIRQGTTTLTILIPISTPLLGCAFLHKDSSCCFFARVAHQLWWRKRPNFLAMHESTLYVLAQHCQK
ncbi:MAG: hypothetical protein CSA33_04330 [Desulfobulbus propionicus]|nr:MAG: hypothetical protein CSA33_04330 [Desulfobulbus propionicus]